jgi:DNA replication ATP-dependent helicase Dna2
MSISALDHAMNEHLTPPLTSWLHKQLLQCHGQLWWRHGVLDRLSDLQRSELPDPNKPDLEQLDLQALLHVASNNFKLFVDKNRISWEVRTPISNMRDARNALSHRKRARPVTDDDLLLYALSLKKLLVLIQAPQNHIAGAEQLIRNLNTPLDFPVLEKEEQSEIGDLESTKDISQTAEAYTYQQERKAEAVTLSAPPTKIAESKVNRLPDTPPLYDGMNDCLTVVLSHAERGSDGRWQLTVAPLTEDEKTQLGTLTVPEYLTSSGRAAAEIWAAVQGQKPEQPIVLNLVNVHYVNGRLHFPDTLPTNTDTYPLIIVQPAYLINVTALTHFDYCPRKYLIDRYSLTEGNKAMMRGSLIHEVFGGILQHPDDGQQILEKCRDTMVSQAPQMVMQGIRPSELYEDSKAHLNALAGGMLDAFAFDDIEEVYIERFMINPKLGLKGKIDALIKKKSGRWQALELKTGKSWGANPNAGHAFQVNAYHLMLKSSGITDLDPPCVIYTGNRAKDPSLAAKTMFKNIPFSAQSAITAINNRNELVRIDYVGVLQFNENDNKCAACVRYGAAVPCVSLHKLGLDGGEYPSDNLEDLLNKDLNHENADLFQRFNTALLKEFQEIRLKHGTALQMAPEQREKDGLCLQVQQSGGRELEGEVELSFPEGNSAELREGDPCLLSDEHGPVAGKCVEVYIRDIDKQRAIVTLPKGVSNLWFDPRYLDVNSPDSAYENNFAALYALTAEDSPFKEQLRLVRDVLANANPRVPSNKEEIIPAKIINDLGALTPTPDQKQAISLALGLEKLLLVQGPPGTGKTYTLAKMIEALVETGKRVLVATYTHRAADEVMSKLEEYAPDVEVRKLGRPEATQRHQDRCLEMLYDDPDRNTAVNNKEELVEQVEAATTRIREILTQPAVYIGTTHAWLSGQHDRLLVNDENQDTASFDVAIVDEASQIVTPNLLGVLRLANKWILVGDHKQLPPVVLSEDAAILKQTLFEVMASKLTDDKTVVTQLRVQYRMPPVIAAYIGHEFYEDSLIDDPSCKDHRLIVEGEGPLFEPDKQLVLVDRKRREGHRAIRQYPDEAEWIIAHLKKLFEAGFPVRGDHGRPTVGVVAPYRAQVAYLRRELENELKDLATADYWRDVVDTVDRFQGDERHLIMVSLCLTASSEPPRIYREPRRINVALSRARDKLCVVGDLDAMAQVPGFSGLRRHVQQHPDHAVEVDGRMSKRSSARVPDIF